MTAVGTTLFDRLFDDAALFPPGEAPMDVAVPAHRDLEATLGSLVGPFVVPAARLDGLVAALGDGPGFGVSVIAAPADLPGAVTRVTGEARLTLAAVEVPVVPDADAARRAVAVLDEALPIAVPAAVELPRTAERDAVLEVLAGSRYRAKLRTGGLRAELFPSPVELAGTLAACVARGVAVKCTAGLHSAVRRTDPETGFVHHGFLNVLLAVGTLTAGGSTDEAAAVLAETDRSALLRELTARDAVRAREVFTSFGTCSVREPVGDLIALGLLPEAV